MTAVALVLYILTALVFAFFLSVCVYEWVHLAMRKKNHPSLILAAFFLMMLGSTAYGLWMYV